jgi:hypothetical protein
MWEVKLMRGISGTLLLASLLIGLAQVAALPPFEGIDETAHYSYIEQIAKTGALPRFNDRIRLDAQNVETYLAITPDSRRWRYRNFFAADAQIVQKVRRAVKMPRDPPPTGEPGEWPNWQLQHPPFYYAVLAPAYLFSERWSLVEQLALLRGLSYIAAWSSLCVAVFVAAKNFSGSSVGQAMITAPALWPFVFPGWFPEMARLGNDSLVALLVACAVAVVTCAPIRRWPAWFSLGVICGLGALTKTTFLPVLAAIAVLLLYKTWQRNAWPRQFLGFLATVLVLAGWWYVQRSLETGMLFATNDGYFLKERGGVMRGLTEYFPIVSLAQGIRATAMSFLWSGTWSFITPPLRAAIPLVAMTLLVGCAYLYGFRRYKMHSLVQITPLILGFWALAIIYPTLHFVAMGNGAGYPGYYFHSLAPALAPVIGIAITIIARHWLARRLFFFLLGYNVLFLLGATLMQFLYFAGCGSNGSRRFDFDAASACWSDWQGLTENLSALAYPLAALGLLAGGAIALGCSAWASMTPANSYTRNSSAVERGASALL